MKNKLQKQLIVTGLLLSAMAVSFPANGITENVCAAESTDSSENEEELQTLFDESVEDAMIMAGYFSILFTNIRIATRMALM